MSPELSTRWLSARMDELGISSLDELQVLTQVNKGTLSKYFHHKQRPTVDVLPKLCLALEISPETLLVVLGVLEIPKGKKIFELGRNQA